MVMLDTSHRRVGVFIDVQNMYYSARNIYGAKVNFGNIVKVCVGNQQLVRAIAYTISTKTGEERPFFEALQGMGIEVAQKELLEYDSGHKKGDWDVGITIDVVRMLDMLDVVVMVSGDGDYCALAEYVKNRGRIFHVASFRESTSSKLVDAADVYTNLSADKKAFLLGAQQQHRTPERRMSSPMDTFDDVIAEQVANRAIEAGEGAGNRGMTIETREEHKESETFIAPIAPVKFNKKPEIEKSPQRRGRPRKPRATPDVPKFPMHG
jgi:uncharacterized LabA/DUF88 family protein